MERDTLLPRTKSLMRQAGLRARKGLGQHFLVDEAVLQTIVAAAALTPADTVVEVGPGLGILTRELAARAGTVIAVELDDGLADFLGRTLAPFPSVKVINQDILGLDPAALVSGTYRVVANLPYYIASPIIRHFLEAPVKPQTMVVMVQKEVAEAIAARPGGMSLLSVSVQFYGKPEIIATVPARSFYPEPEVDSALLRIEVYPRPAVPVADESGFFDMVRAGFAAPRKQIANSLAQGTGIPKGEVEAILERAGIVRRRRAETLALEEWAQLYEVFPERTAER